MHHNPSLQYQRGFTLLEMAIGLAIMGLVFAGIWRLIGNMNQQLQDQAIARQTRTIQESVIKYVNAEQSNIKNVIPTSGQWATVEFTDSNPSGGLNGLKPNYLASSVNESNILGQSYKVLVHNNNGVIESFVLATGSPYPLPEYRLIRIASLLGADGGIVLPSDSTKILGAYGSWSLSTSYFIGSNVSLQPSDLVVSTYYAQGEPNDYLHQDLHAGQPELNRMNTAIDMNNNGLTNLGSITASNLPITADTITITHSAGIGTAANMTINGHIVVRQNEGLYGAMFTAGSLYVGCNVVDNCTSVKLLLDAASGNLTSQGSANLSGNLTAGGTVTASQANISGQASVGTLVSAGDVRSGGNLLVGGRIRPINWPTANITNLDGYLNVTGGGTFPLGISSGSISVNGNVSASGNGGFGSLQVNGTSNLQGRVDIWTDSYIKGGQIMTWSDRRFKKDIHPLQNALDKLLRIQGVSYTGRTDNKKNVGVIAQDVEKVYPELVKTDVKDGMKYVNYPQLAGPMIEAIRELKIQIDDLKKENFTLKKEITLLKNQAQKE